jgi:hypothetical protein
MKKLIIVVLFCFLLGGTAFGEFEFSGGGRAVFDVFGIRFGSYILDPGKTGTKIHEREVPFATTMGSENTYNTNGPEVNLNFRATTPGGIFGMAGGVALDSNGSRIIYPSNAKVWAQPLDWLKITLGRFEEDNLRFKIGASGSGFGNYEVYIRKSQHDENAVFSRFKSKGFGAHITLTPLEGLYIGAAFGSVTNVRSFTALSENGALNILKNAQAGIGYTIPGIGLARLQWIGEYPFMSYRDLSIGVDNEFQTDIQNDSLGPYQFLERDEWIGRAAAIQGAFQLTAIEGLNIDLGFSIPLLMKWGNTDNFTGYPNDEVLMAEHQKPFIIGLGFDVTMFKPWRVYGRIDTETGGYRKLYAVDDPAIPSNQYDQYLEDKKHGTGIFTSIFVSYDLPRSWVIGVDFIYDLRFGDQREAAIYDAGTLATKWARGNDNEQDPTLTITHSTGELNNYLDLGFGVWARWNVAGGDIRLAVTMKVPDVSNHGHDGAQPQLFFPVMFNYSF